MRLKVLAFGIARDIFGSSIIELELHDGAITITLKNLLEERYPRLKKLASYMVAVNNEYADNKTILHERDEIAIIPPVSGG